MIRHEGGIISISSTLHTHIQAFSISVKVLWCVTRVIFTRVFAKMIFKADQLNVLFTVDNISWHPQLYGKVP
jgi:hypothetical protein